MNPLHLPEQLARQIERHGIDAHPSECCGVLYGRDVTGSAGGHRWVEALEPVENGFAPEEQTHRFLIAPETLLRAERRAGEEGRLVLGFYHSHPDAPARPSEYDRERAWPFYSYVIVSVSGGRAVETTSWVLDEATEQFGRQSIVELEGVKS